MSDDMLTRLARVIAAAAVQREIDNQPCPTCGGDPLRPAFDGRAECHAPWPTRIAEAQRSPDEGDSNE